MRLRNCFNLFLIQRKRPWLRNFINNAYDNYSDNFFHILPQRTKRIGGIVIKVTAFHAGSPGSNFGEINIGFLRSPNPSFTSDKA